MDSISPGVSPQTPKTQHETSNEKRCSRVEEDQKNYFNQKKMTKKKVSFDDEVGGAISSAQGIESGAPAVMQMPDFRNIVDDFREELFRGSQQERTDVFKDALNMNYQNMVPGYMMDTLYEREDPILIKDAMLQGITGTPHQDPHDIQKAVIHSLKRFPRLLQAYLKNLV